MNTNNGQFPTNDQPLLEMIVGSISHTVDSFLKEKRASGISHKTIRIYTYELVDITHYLGDRHIKVMDAITPDILRDYLELLGKHRNKGGVHIAYRVIRTFTYWYEQETDGEYRSPIRKVKLAPPRPVPISGVPVEDIERMLKYCDTDEGKRDKAVFLLLLDTGIRANELLTANIGDLNISENKLHIIHGKGDKQRDVFMGRRTRAALRAYLKTRALRKFDPLFLTDDGDRMTYTTLRQIIRRRAANAKLANTPSPHDFRRTFVLECLRNGMDLETLRRITGWSSLEVLRRYADMNIDDLRLAHGRASPADRM